MAPSRFRSSELREARGRAKLTQLQLATLAQDVVAQGSRPGKATDGADERARRIRAWEGRIGAWERGGDAPSAPYIPTLARVLGVQPLTLFEVDPAAPPFTALRLAAGWTLQALAEATGISYTSLHRMVRGVARVSDDAAQRLAGALNVTVPDLLASIARDRA